MGTLVGHVAPGAAFFLLGFWHLFNHIKLHLKNPNSYASSPWFPAPKLRYLELILIMVGSSISVSMELFIGPAKHQPFDADGTIPSYHLQNFEHSSISMTFFVYATFSIILDRINPKFNAQSGLTQFLGALAFSQQLFIFHNHSADHMGVEGKYHLLLQFVILVTLATTILGIGYPESFLISFVRSISVMFQGIWLALMGYMLWIPSLVPKGCFVHSEVGHQVVRCDGVESLHRAKSLVNIEFSWLLIGMAIFVLSFYLVLIKFYGERGNIYSMVIENDDDDVEAQVKTKFENSKCFFGKEKAGPIDMEM